MSVSRTSVLVLLAVVCACSEKAPPAKTADSAAAKAAAAPPPAPPITDAPAPETFRVRVETSKGAFVLELTRGWSPHGVDRFHHLVQDGYFKDVRFFRVLPGFVAQFGINGDPAVNAKWKEATIADEPMTQLNKKGTLVFATAGPNTRSNQLFINLVDNAQLNAMGFTPIGRVVDGMKVVESLYGGYGEAPDQGQLGAEGNKYLVASFPKLDYIKSATIAGAPAK